MVSAVNATDLNKTDVLGIEDNNVLSADIYVDINEGDDANDGKSEDESIKNFAKALEIAKDNDTIILSDGVYGGEDNTKIIIDKSITIQGGKNTTFDGDFSNYLFIVTDNVSVAFKNINFVNAYKHNSDMEILDGYDIEGIYGSALDIKDARVTLDNCYFQYNLAGFNSIGEFVYGGAISNCGDLTILNTDFYSNAISSNSEIFGYGGSIYNKARLVINNSKFIESSGYLMCYGGAIYNDGELIMDKSSIAKSSLGENSKGSAIYNAGNCTILNSIIENNIIEPTDFTYIYGAIFNSGNLIARSNIFKNNSAVYKQPFTEFTGSPMVYNIGNLDLTYNAFIDNVGFNGIATDIYLNAGGTINVDDNWWNTNDDPFSFDKINFDCINSWITSQLTPQYSSLKINEKINISHSWVSTNGEVISNSLVPAFEVVVSAFVGGNEISKKFMTNESIAFNFNNTSVKGSHVVRSNLNSIESRAVIDVGKINTYMDVFMDKNSFYYEEMITLNITLKDEDGNPLSGKINLQINDENKVVDVDGGMGSISFSNLDPKNYKVTLIYNGDSDHNRAFNQTTFSVNKTKSQLIISNVDDIKTNDTLKLNVVLKYASSSVASLYVNGIFKQEIYLNNGNTTLNLDYLEEGQYNVTIIYPENDYYESARDSVIFNVVKAHASINVYCQNITSGDDEIITIEVSTENFNSEVILSINGVNTTVLLKNKINTFKIYGLTNGTYKVNVFFKGNNRFNKTNSSSYFVVTRGKSSLNVSIEKNNLTGTVTVKTNQTKCSGIVDLFINNKHYVASLFRGQATFNVEFSKGSNYIYVFYGGDNNYDGSTWNTSIGEPINPFLIAENITCYEFNNFTYSVILCEENGFAVPNKNIIIKFLGKTYNVTTNNYGIANLTFNLNEGNYTIVATYENSTIVNNIFVEKIKFNLFAQNISYLDDEVVEVSFERNISGFVNFTLSNGITKLIEIKNNTAIWNISNLNAGQWDVEAFYTNDLFNSSSVKKSFKVNKANFTFDVSYSGLNFGSQTAITLTLPTSITGNITFFVDTFKYEKSLEKDYVVLKLDNLDKGKHNLTISYSGDVNFNEGIFNTQFSIRSLNATLELLIDDVVYGDMINVMAKLDKNATGEIIFTIDSISFNAKINNGTAVWMFNGLNVGNYTICANYSGDDNYFDTVTNANFSINKANSHINLYAKEVYLDQNIRIYADLSQNATGVISFSMKDYYSPRNKTISNSKSNWYISPLEYGQYTVFAQYFGDKNYNPSNATFILNVTQYRSVLGVTIDDATNNERVVANIRLFNDRGIGITDKVTLTLDSKQYDVNIRRGIGSLVIGKLPIGKYTFSAVFKGNEKYSGSSANGSFNVIDSHFNVNLIVGNFTKYVGSNEQFNIILSDLNGKSISDASIQVLINNNTFDLITDSEGVARLDIDYPIGVYTAVIKFNQTDKYYGAEETVNIEVLSTIRSFDLTKVYGTGGQYFAIFTDCNGKALANTPVTFTISGKDYQFVTAPNGVARININIKPGKYTITAFNPVSGEKAFNTIYIFQYIMENKDLTFYYGANKKFTARLFDSNGNPVGEGVSAVVKINGKTYNVQTDKLGYINLKVNMKPKTYTITTSYNGFTVTNKVIIKPVLSANNIIVKKGKIFKFKAKLVNSKGKALKGKKIIFKFKGKTYKSKTNKKGFASIKINLKLKIGKHKIKVKWGKNKIMKIIKVTK